MSTPNESLPPGLFLGKSKLVARKQGRCAEKASAQLFRISDCGFRIFWISFSIRIPQSAFRNLDARPVQEMKPALWFFRGTPLLPGRATPEIQSIFRLLAGK